MDTSREDFGIAFRSALLVRGTKQKFSLIVLVTISIALIFLETLELKPINYFRSFIKDSVYRGSQLVSMPSKTLGNFTHSISEHINLYKNYNELKKQNDELKNNVLKSDFLKLENTQLRKLIEEDVGESTNFTSARVLLDKQSPYLNSFIINVGSNKNIKNGMAVLDGQNFIGRIVDVNFFSSRVLLVTDLNSKIAVLTKLSAHHAILSGHGESNPSLDYLPKNYNIQDGDIVYTSGKEGIFKPGIPVGEIKKDKDIIEVLLFSDLNQITFVNISMRGLKDK